MGDGFAASVSEREARLVRELISARHTIAMCLRAIECMSHAYGEDRSGELHNEIAELRRSNEGHRARAMEAATAAMCAIGDIDATMRALLLARDAVRGLAPG